MYDVRCFGANVLCMLSFIKAEGSRKCHVQYVHMVPKILKDVVDTV